MNSFAGLTLVIASKTNLKVQGVSIIDVKWTNMRDSASHILPKKITGSVTSAHQVNIKSQISDSCMSESLNLNQNALFLHLKPPGYTDKLIFIFWFVPLSQ